MQKLDDLQLALGAPYVLNKHITIKQPKIDNIMRFGEERYFRALAVVTSIPSDSISMLADLGIDWEKISDFEYFMLAQNTMGDEECNFFFDGVRFSEYRPALNDNGDRVLKNVLNGSIIDPYVYNEIATFIRKVHGIKPKIIKAGNALTKKKLIEIDRLDRNAAKNDNKSQLYPLISSLVNSAGFKYNWSSVGELTYYQLVDSLRRVSTIKHADALTNGAYCGMVNMKKIPKEEFNWMRDLNNN